MSLLQNSNAIDSGGAYTISSSVRVRGSVNADLKRVFTNSNSSFTFSAWIKRGGISSGKAIFGVDSANNIQFEPGDSLRLNAGAAGARINTTSVFRDPSAWYHVVAVRNGGQGGTTSVWTLYVNNVSVGTYTGDGGTFLSAATHGLGSYNSASNNFDGYMTDVYLVDGQALTPSSFGQTDGTTGVWKPKAYTGTYGTNGFYLPFKSTAGPVTLKSSQLSKQTSSSTTITVTVPSVSNGDLMVMVVNSAGASGTTWTTPSGWTAGANNAAARAVFYRRASSEPASYTVTQSANDKSDGTILVFTNADYDTDSANSTNATTITPGTITVASNNSTVLYVAYDSQLSRSPNAGPTGYTNLISDSDATAPSQLIYSLSGVSAGSYTGPTITTSNSMRCFVIAIKPKLVVGADYSGNNNTWDTSTISTTAGTTYDLMTDSPTLTSASIANYCTLNPLNYSGSASVDGNLGWSSSGLSENIKSTIGMSSGKWYWESVCNSASNNGQWSLYDQSNTSASTLGINTVTANTLVGFRFDASAGTWDYTTNGSSWISIATGLTTNAPYFVGLTSTGSTAKTWAMNFGQRPFTYTPPTGYVALNTYNLPDSTIKKGNSYMDATTYTGTTSALTITNAGGFKPDFVWTKKRNSATSSNHNLFDSNRGVTKFLTTAATDAETTQVQSLTSFNSNGFSVGTNANINNNGDTFVGWQWKSGQGSTSTNTNGSITSTVQVDTTAGFSIVTFSNTGGTAGTVGHGLGVAPKLIIHKATSTTGNWFVYLASLGATSNTLLDSTAATNTASTAWNSTAPTSSVFSVGSVLTTATRIAYCFAEVPGFSKFGSYIGNGATDGPFVYLGFRPKYLLIKQSSAGTTGWIITDSTTNPTNIANLGLVANTTAAEATGSGTTYPYVDLLSNGFKIRSSGSSTNSANTYIYIAFAENPFKNSLAR